MLKNKIKLVNNQLKDFYLFNLCGKKFIKITHHLSFQLIKNQKHNNNFFSIVINNKTYSSNDSLDINYIHILEYNSQIKVTLKFLYKSGSINNLISKTFKLSNYINNNLFICRVSNNNFFDTLKDIENNAESYTKDEICGVIESILNH